MAIHITPPAQPSGAMSNAQLAIEVIPLPDGIRHNQNLPAFVADYYSNTHQIRDFFPSLAERLRTRGYDHAAGDAKDVLMSRAFFLTQEMLELSRATEQQSRIQATLRSIDNGLDVELDRLNAWKKLSVTFFTLTAAAVTVVNVNPKMIAAAAAAVATAATVLISGLGKGIHSLLKKRESSVKKNRDIIRAMLKGAEIIISNLTQVYILACYLQSETASIWEMVDDGATDVSVREKVSVLNKSFRKLQRKARSCSLDVSSATEAVLQSIIRNSD